MIYSSSQKAALSLFRFKNQTWVLPPTWHTAHTVRQGTRGAPGSPVQDESLLGPPEDQPLWAEDASPRTGQTQSQVDAAPEPGGAGPGFEFILAPPSPSLSLDSTPPCGFSWCFKPSCPLDGTGKLSFCLPFNFQHLWGEGHAGRLPWPSVPREAEGPPHAARQPPGCQAAFKPPF